EYTSLLVLLPSFLRCNQGNRMIISQIGNNIKTINLSIL
ncbi:MAG: hypothetical protein BECKG1743D_GA0114223_104961, partial [Candidatus Kentron sp. G]